MMIPVQFRLHGNLNDFIRPKYRFRWFAYGCPDTSSVKDAAEAVGVPHVEMAAIQINQALVPLSEPLHAGDQIEIFPAFQHPPLLEGYQLRLPLPPKPGFILDVHLGKLARLLRMAGLDCLYERDYADEQIARIAVSESRVVLTRDVPLLKRKALQWGYWLRSQMPEEQLTEVLTHFQLFDQLRPFTRCTVCNGPLTTISKAEVQSRFEPLTEAHFNEFFQCTCCKQVYWKGSHYERMEAFLDRLRLKRVK